MKEMRQEGDDEDENTSKRPKGPLTPSEKQNERQHIAKN